MDNSTAVAYVNKMGGTHLLTGLPPVAMMPTEGNPSVCRTPSRGCKHNSRPGIPADRSFNRTEKFSSGS